MIQCNLNTVLPRCNDTQIPCEPASVPPYHIASMIQCHLIQCSSTLSNCQYDTVPPKYSVASIKCHPNTLQACFSSTLSLCKYDTVIFTIIHYHPGTVILPEWWRQLIVEAMIWRGVWFHLKDSWTQRSTVHGKVFLQVSVINAFKHNTDLLQY